MAWTLASHAINDVRHLLLKRHLSSIRIDLTRYNETRNKLQFLMPTKDIPTPKGLLLTDNLFRRFMPYIGGKSFFIYALTLSLKSLLFKFISEI